MTQEKCICNTTMIYMDTCPLLLLCSFENMERNFRHQNNHVHVMYTEQHEIEPILTPQLTSENYFLKSQSLEDDVSFQVDTTPKAVKSCDKDRDSLHGFSRWKHIWAADDKSERWSKINSEAESCESLYCNGKDIVPQILFLWVLKSDRFEGWYYPINWMKSRISTIRFKNCWAGTIQIHAGYRTFADEYNYIVAR